MVQNNGCHVTFSCVHPVYFDRTPLSFPSPVPCSRLPVPLSPLLFPCLFLFKSAFYMGSQAFLSLASFSFHEELQVPSIFLQRIWFGFSLWLNETPLCKHHILYRSHSWVDDHEDQLHSLAVVGTAALTVDVRGFLLFRLDLFEYVPECYSWVMC